MYLIKYFNKNKIQTFQKLEHFQDSINLAKLLISNEFFQKQQASAK